MFRQLFTPFLFENAHSGAFSSAKSKGSMRIFDAQRCKNPEVKPEEPFNTDCLICLREREPYMMITLSCNHRYCKECLNVWSWSQNSEVIRREKIYL